ncbi:MAG TPA: hypothetical protein PLK35_01865 [Candidatus Moranbacteria bacterium]|nr:hypothetical protein [Candidatus Moranbacteria bacterium]
MLDVIGKLGELFDVPDGHAVLKEGNFFSFIGYQRYGTARHCVVAEGGKILIVDLKDKRVIGFARNYQLENIEENHREKEVLEYIIKKKCPNLKKRGVYALERSIYQILEQ